MDYLVALLKLILVFNVAVVSASEPECLKFTYEEQLLEKMIRMEVKVEQMANDIKRTQAEAIATIEKQDVKLKEYSEKIVALESEAELTKARQKERVVGFSAYSPVSKSLKTNEIFVLSMTTFNLGNGYDTNTGIFTSAEKGLYLFTVHVCNELNRYVHYAIIQENTQIALSEQRDSDINTCSSVDALAIVNQGEKVFVRCTAGYSSGNQIIDDVYRRTTFQGVLLYRIP